MNELKIKTRTARDTHDDWVEVNWQDDEPCYPLDPEAITVVMPPPKEEAP